MSQCIEITWTNGSIDEARRICRFLVQERLVACAQIVPWVESIYMWNNQLETSQECKVVMKTQLQHFAQIKDAIIENCTYDVPEIVYSIISGGHEDYLAWVEESTPNLSTSQPVDGSI
jgi:periplasmic divalent cation tolerance protein